MPRFKLAGTACPFLAHLGLIALLCGCIKAQGDKNIQTKVPLSPIEKKPGLINPPETPNTNEKKPDNKPSCALPDTASRFRLAPPAAAAGAAKPSFADIQGLIDGACKSCHLAPAANFGGFTYANSYRSQKLIINEKQLEVPGYFESAEKLRDVLLKGSMPPENIRQKNPEAYLAMGHNLDEWIKAGKPEKPSEQLATGEDYPELWGNLQEQTISDLGNCLPDSKQIGTDPITDYYFEQAETLPDLLTETDMHSFDNASLAAKGTLSYNIEYPLWNDHTRKLRHVHVPAIINNGKSFKPKPLPILQADRNKEPVFTIPENTRYYKTFFRGELELDASIRYKPIETRVIVVRYPPRKPLYGTYVWQENGSNAKLLTTPYRDGSAWKDLTLSLPFNKQTGTHRKYLVPARHRCAQCHAGAANESFVLGFTPLQINRRDMGEAGRDLPTGKDELSQTQRFVEYGLLTAEAAAQLPKLEYFPSTRILDDHTMRAQGYMLGNCTHCHNPKGYAKNDAKVPMDLSAGQIFNFDTNLSSVFFQNRKIVHHQGNLEQSYLFHRVAAADQELKLEARMPLHSIGSPDCRLVKVMARWIKSYDPTLNNFELNKFEANNACSDDKNFAQGDIDVLEQDPTETAGPYKPRREDWDDSKNGMTEWFRSLTLNKALQKLTNLRYAVDWWQEKPECKFPIVPTLDPSLSKAWMLKPDKTSVKPFGQLYWTSAGAYFYNMTCTKCHGRLGEADGPLANNLDKWSGGNIRVANFRKGLFGHEGKNLEQFLRKGPAGETIDYSGNYFIWMALEGTKMNPPPQVADLLGANKAQMLKTIMDRCARQIPSHPKATKAYFRDFDVFEDICSFENWPSSDERLKFDLDTGKPLHPDELDTWLKKAAANAGWAIYDYVKNSLAKGVQIFPQSDCESVFGS